MILQHMITVKKRRLLIFIAVNAVVLLCIPLFFIFRRIMYSVNPAMLKCILHDTLHLYCPTCGGTRAVCALLRFDIIGALKSNAFAVSFAVIFLYYDIRAFIAILKKKQRVLFIPAYVWILLLIWLAVFAVGRNLLMIYCGTDPLGDLVRFWR